MDIRAEELAIYIKSNQVHPDAYANWKDNPVTQRFMAEAELELLSLRAAYISGTTCEPIALGYVANSASRETLEDILEWKPNELIIEE
jgi:hypothetical protein